MRIAVVTDAFPVLSETFVVNEVAAMRRAGHEVSVVASGRRGAAHAGEPRLEVVSFDEAGRAAKLAAAMRLALRVPRAVARDRTDRAAWRPAEQPRSLAALAPVVEQLRAWGAEHLHVHFAAGAALEGLRMGALLGVPVSITAHAYDIFLTPRNLERKLARSAFVTTGCAYNVAHLRAVAPAADVHEVVMGVEVSVFRRTRAHPGTGRVLAVGRLVEKKGFADLIRACARLHDDRAFAGLTIVGEGPLDGELRALAQSSEIAEDVLFAGARTPTEVRALLEDASVLAMPCVIAADGDRDSMPVVVKEALAMEVPVVATDVVGLPEVVDESCGRLVPPGDPPALAAALGELLALAPEDRAALGRAGRARVLDRCDVDRETAKLLRLIESAR